MKTREESLSAWKDVRRELAQLSVGAIVRLPRETFPHPRDAGARLTITWPAGQMADYAIDAENGEAPLVVREYQDRYEAMIDGVWLAAGSIDLTGAGPTAAMYMGGALLGGAIGSAVTNKRQGMLLGVGLGLAFAALLDAGLEDVGKRRQR